MSRHWSSKFETHIVPEYKKFCNRMNSYKYSVLFLKLR